MAFHRVRRGCDRNWAFNDGSIGRYTSIALDCLLNQNPPARHLLLGYLSCNVITGEYWMPSESIVVIDSEPIVRNVITEILSRAGYQVRATGEPDTAFEMVR